MSPTAIARLWILPWKYWSATAGMTQPEIDALMDKIQFEAETGNVEALRRYDFISLENPYLAWRREREAEFPFSRYLREVQRGKAA